MAAVVILFASALACPRAHGEQEQTDLPVNLKGEAIDPLAKVKSPAGSFAPDVSLPNPERN